jgi:hypothetical protein
MNDITLIYPYYDNPAMLEEQIGNWKQYPKNVLKHLKLVIVDDGSPKYPSIDCMRNIKGLPLSLYRIAVDIPWNQHGARNLGMGVCQTKWALLSDIDHLILPDQMEKIMGITLNDKWYYRFARKNYPNLDDYKFHCNSLLVNKDAYWKAGGYDEDYCGSYGGDGQFIRLLETVCMEDFRDDIFLVRYARDFIPDASTTTYSRTGEFKERYRSLLERKKAEHNTFPKNPIRFKWEKLL